MLWTKLIILPLVNISFLLTEKSGSFFFVIVCPLGSFFYNGSCYFYLPPKPIDNLKGIRFDDVSADEGKKIN
jgi:hypothetical protein